MNRKIVLIVHNIRSTHNVGSILRTADGLGVERVYLTGYTPFPNCKDDGRLPHIAHKLNQQIHKTALGAEEHIDWQYEESPKNVINRLRSDGFTIAALEQTNKSQPLNEYPVPQKIAILLGEEVNGIHKDLLKQCDTSLEIPMFGKKESFNVSIAAAIAIYHFRFIS